MKKLLFPGILAAVIAIVVVAYMYNKPHQNMSKAKVEATVSASALVKAFQDDEEKANTSYLDKVIAVSGKLREMETSEDGNIQLFLDSGDPLSAISCQLDPLSKHTGLDNLNVGSEVSLKGICTGMLMDVVIERCVVIQ